MSSSTKGKKFTRDLSVAEIESRSAKVSAYLVAKGWQHDETRHGQGVHQVCQSVNAARDDVKEHVTGEIASLRAELDPVARAKAIAKAKSMTMLHNNAIRAIKAAGVASRREKKALAAKRSKPADEMQALKEVVETTQMQALEAWHDFDAKFPDEEDLKLIHQPPL